MTLRRWPCDLEKYFFWKSCQGVYGSVKDHLKFLKRVCVSPNYTPSPPKVEGGILDSPWRLSVGPSVCRQGFRNFLKKIICSIHFIPGIYPYGVSLWTPIHFRVPTINFGPLVAKYLPENGVSGIFWKNYLLNSFDTWHLPLWGESFDSYWFSSWLGNFWPSGDKKT